MTSEPILVDAALKLLPPRIRHALLDDRLFIERWGISTVTQVTLGKGGPSFRRDRFYDAIRKAIRKPEISVHVEAQGDSNWTVLVQPQDKSLLFSINSGDKHYSITDHSAIAEDAAVRTAWFERTAKEINFEGAAYQSWLARIPGAPLSDDEFAELMTDIEWTPVSVYHTLHSSMEQADFDVTTLVPCELRYYERLVGQLGSATSVEEFIDAQAKPQISGLQRWDSFHGLLYALLTCSMEQIADYIQIENLSCDELTKAYQWLTEHGDPISQVGAVEVALSHLDTHPELAPFIEQMVEGLIADDPENDSSGFALLSAMIVMVSSELARRCTLGSPPPFYRKQAAIAQASLIVRSINCSRIDPASVVQWARNSGLGHTFLLQGLIDLRCEPRWLPDFASADQLRAEFVGRISNAATRNKTKIQTESLRTLLLESTSKLANAARWPFSNFPGPLEGGVTPRHAIPDDILKDVRVMLEADHLEANSFAGLVNTALLFNLPEGQSSLAADALRRVKFSIENVGDEDKSFGLIGGLAVVAAVTRGTDLANALRVLTRVMRRRKRLMANPSDEIRIAMISAASHENLDDWARFAGEWMTEIAFETADKDAAKDFLLTLRSLVQMEPALARHCAIADAALAAFAS
ncbi:hypothetical protein [Microbulbifer halophilus]|uniref:Uncharacterized protein n=1 Tax=Microbulbifer halophilus TaxID=453963 RepID=A0ABW5EG61_9GAMM|nr:hypothetical protein [Microbulbifer halophilus]MCW8126047.1 hypothetical protein [Microbulbifer halophilus]